MEEIVPMKYKKLIISILVFLSVFLIYVFNNDQRMNYIALGDSLAAGQNPYGEINFGYTDYIANYLSRNNLLKFYTKGFAQSGDKTTDLLEAIQDNKTIQVDDKIINIKSSLRASNLVTISIGANDFIQSFNLANLKEDLKNLDLIQKVDEVLPKLDQTLKEIRKYAKNEVVVIGYYNPLPRLTSDLEEDLDKIFAYIDLQYQSICNKYKMTYLSTYDIFKNNDDYLPNPLDIHPNTKGYEAISRTIIDYLEKKVLN